MNNEILISIISGLGAFFLNVLYNTLNNKKKEKIRNRSFINVDVIYNIGANLEGYPIEDVAKVAYTKTYSDITKFQDRNRDLKLYCNFIRVQNSDNNFITNFQFRSSQVPCVEGMESWEVEVKASNLQKSEIIFINTDNFLNNDEEIKYVTNKIQICYDTPYGEKIRYENILNKDGTIEETYYSVRRWFKDKKILQITNENIDWVLIPENDRKIAMR